MELKLGLKFSCEQIVTSDMTAAKYGSGLVEVFATPAMIAFIENTALKSVLPHLPEGENTVGIHVNISHSKATPVGMKVFCETEITEIDGKKITFKVTVRDEIGEIGSGTHTRFIINTQKFMQKLAGK